MSIAINGTGTITGITAGGLPDAIVQPADLTQPLTLGTLVNSTSGTSVLFTGIPAWARRITVMLNGVSTNSTNNIQLQLGSTTIDISGYTGGAGGIRAGGTSLNYANSTGFIIVAELSAALTYTGAIELTYLTANTWILTGTINDSSASRTTCSSGAKSLSGVLDRLQIIASATGSASDTFDAGSVNILYE